MKGLFGRQVLVFAFHCLLAVLLVSGTWSPRAVGASALLMALIALSVWGVRRRQYSPSGVARWVVVAIAAPGLTAIISLLVSADEYWDWARVDLPSRYLLVVPLYLVLSRLCMRATILASLYAFAAISAGVIAYINVYHQGMPQATGALGHHIIFGNISAVLAATALASGLLLRTRGWWFLLLGLVGFAVGAFAVLLSSARGAWVTLVVLLLLMPMLTARRAVWLKSAIATIGVIGCGFLIYNLPAAKVKHRIDVVFLELERFADPGGQYSSVGARLEMWKAAGLIFSAQPIFGAGPRTFDAESKKLVESGEVREYGHFQHAHNQYLNTLAATGLLGFLALLMLYGVPLCLVYPYLRREDVTQRVFSAFVVLLVVGYIVAGFTETVLNRHASIMFYLVTLSLGLSQLPIAKHRSSQGGYHQGSND